MPLPTKNTGFAIHFIFMWSLNVVGNTAFVYMLDGITEELGSLAELFDSGVFFSCSGNIPFQVHVVMRTT